MSQQTYIQKLLQRYRLENIHPVSTPAATNVHLRQHTEDTEAALVDKSLYQSMVGSLLYCALGTRPDIQYAVCKVAQFNSQPNQHHLTAVKRIFQYLSGTLDLSLTYQRKGSVSLEGYADADFASDQSDRKSISGYCFFMCGSLVSWYTGKQKAVSVSTSNAEYIALGIAVREALFLQHLLEEIGVKLGPTVVYEDNQSTLAMTWNPVYHGKQKHIAVQHHFLRDEVSKQTVNLVYCPTEQMIADIMTKPLATGRHHKLTESLGLVELP